MKDPQNGPIVQRYFTLLQLIFIKLRKLAALFRHSKRIYNMIQFVPGNGARESLSWILATPYIYRKISI